MRFSRIITAALSLLIATSAEADKGFWPVQDMDATLERDMKALGLRLSLKDIYKTDAPGNGVADAVVSFGFRYTGSVVSDKGLVLTTYAPAEAYLERLGEAGQELLKNGFWTDQYEREIPVQGEKVYSLKRIFDVTQEIKASIKRLGSEEAAIADFVRAYNEATGLTCVIEPFWKGEKYCMYAYKVYDDVRLVVVPPRSVARFGGEKEQWDWPVQRCDFALYRLYEKGKPAVGERSLEVSKDGYSEGSFAMTVGFPISTMRYGSSASTGFRERVSLPVLSGFRNRRMDIISSQMAKDPSVRAKYSARAEDLEKWLQSTSGEASLYKKYHLARKKEASEAGMSEDMLAGLKDAMDKMETVEKDRLLRQETLQDGTFIGRYLRRAEAAASVEKAKEILQAAARETDPKVEKELLAYALEEYYTNLDNFYFGPYQQWIQARFGYDYEAASEYIWDHSLMASPDKVNELESASDIQKDPLWKILSYSPLTLYDGLYDYKALQDQASSLEDEYLKSVYHTALRKGEPVYPDANSTLRLNFGRVGSYYPSDGVFCDWHTAPGSILKKYSPSDPDYAMEDRYRQLIEKDFWGRWGFKIDGKRHGMIVDFLTDLDYVDGCSGAPVMDAYGRLIGLVSGGNADALAGQVSYTDYFSRCVSTDVRYILWFLDRYSGLKSVVKEFESN